MKAVKVCVNHCLPLAWSRECFGGGDWQHRESRKDTHTWHGGRPRTEADWLVARATASERRLKPKRETTDESAWNGGKKRNESKSRRRTTPFSSSHFPSGFCLSLLLLLLLPPLLSRELKTQVREREKPPGGVELRVA